MTSLSAEDTAFGLRRGRSLRLYDPLVFGVTNRLIWRASTQKQLEFYNSWVSSNHLEVGVGSGFFVDHCHFPHPPRLALMDASKDCLTFSATRLQRYRPSIHEHDILNPIQWEREGFDSISLGYLLHCLPGAMPEKSIVFKHLKPLMKPKGVLFGSTLLGREEQETWAARQLMDYYNRRGVFSNRDDNVDALKFELECNFGVFEVKRVGSAAFFWAKL